MQRVMFYTFQIQINVKLILISKWCYALCAFRETILSNLWNLYNGNVYGLGMHAFNHIDIFYISCQQTVRRQWLEIQCSMCSENDSSCKYRTLPSMMMQIVSLRTLMVVRRTRMEKRNVQIGSASRYFSSGYINKKITSKVKTTILNAIIQYKIINIV